MGRTTALRRELRNRFIPAVVEQGFRLDERNAPVFLAFRRSAVRHVHIFEFQWDKYGEARFRINFGTCPAKGVTLGSQHVPAGDVFASWLPDTGSLTPRRGTSTRSWFRQDRTLWQRMLGKPRIKEPSEVVAEVTALFVELQAYWSNGVSGPHMRHWGSARYAPQDDNHV